MDVMEDLSQFGYRELELAKDILDALINSGAPSDFEDGGWKIMFNSYSGNVFLTNDDYQAALVTDGELSSFYVLMGTGAEGFAWELYDYFKDGEITDGEDLNQLIDIFENSDDAESSWADEVRTYMEDKGIEIY